MLLPTTGRHALRHDFHTIQHGLPRHATTHHTPCCCPRERPPGCGWFLGSNSSVLHTALVLPNSGTKSLRCIGQPPTPDTEGPHKRCIEIYIALLFHIRCAMLPAERLQRHTLSFLRILDVKPNARSTAPDVLSDIAHHSLWTTRFTLPTRASSTIFCRYDPDTRFLNHAITAHSAPADPARITPNTTPGTPKPYLTTPTRPHLHGCRAGNATTRSRWFRRATPAAAHSRGTCTCINMSAHRHSHATTPVPFSRHKCPHTRRSAHSLRRTFFSAIRQALPTAMTASQCSQYGRTNDRRTRRHPRTSSLCTPMNDTHMPAPRHAPPTPRKRAHSA